MTKDTNSVADYLEAIEDDDTLKDVANYVGFAVRDLIGNLQQDTARMSEIINTPAQKGEVYDKIWGDLGEFASMVSRIANISLAIAFLTGAKNLTEFVEEVEGKCLTSLQAYHMAVENDKPLDSIIH